MPRIFKVGHKIAAIIASFALQMFKLNLRLRNFLIKSLMIPPKETLQAYFTAMVIQKYSPWKEQLNHHILLCSQV
jgi:hypothetical protein